MLSDTHTHHHPQVLLIYFGSTLRNLSDIVHGNVHFGVAQKVILGVNAGMIVVLILVLFFAGRKAFKTISNGYRENDQHAEDSTLILDSEETPLLKEMDDQKEEDDEDNYEDDNPTNAGRFKKGALTDREFSLEEYSLSSPSSEKYPQKNKATKPLLLPDV